MWDSPAFGLFNLKRQRHEMRMSSREWTVSQAIFSDQFETRYADLYQTDENVQRMVDKSVAQIERDHLLFELAETAFALPAYFAARVQFLENREVETQLAKPNGAKAKYALRAPQDMRIVRRTVATLDFSGSRTTNHIYTPPRFRVEVEGYFRRLSPGARGHDSEGREIIGKTWVTKHARWKDKPERLGVVHVKSLIGKALARASGGESVEQATIVVPPL